MQVSIDLFSLAGKVAVVTAAGRGIGRGIALGFARLGADLVLADINATTLAEVSSEIRQLGREPLTIAADLTRDGDVSGLIDQAVARYGRIDMMANVVGGIPMKDRGPAVELSEDSWDAVVELNLKTVFLCSRAAARTMIKQGTKGSIINLASISGINRNPRGSHYGAAKAAVIHLTKTLAHELGPSGIRVNAIATGVIDTLLNRDARAFFKVDDEALARAIPLQRLGEVEDVAAVAIFLASEAAAYVTGQTIVVGGGLEFWGN